MQGKFGKEQDNTKVESTETETTSAKAIKTIADLTISGGTFTIDSSDDALHSNNSVTISGGDLSIAAGDDGIHGDSTVIIKEGKVNITKSYEGIESANITIEGGETHVVASDDGVNVSSGSEASPTQGAPGQNNANATVDSNLKLNINGGYLSVNSLGDGLDSNGSIYMTAGTVVVNGPTNNGNGALDFDGVFEISGGTLVSAGSSKMAQAPTDQSTEYSIIMNYSSVQKAGTIVNLKDSSGNTVATFAPEKDYQSVVITSPSLKKGTAYTLYSGGTSTGSESNGLYTDGQYNGGIKVVDFTIADITTWLSETGITESKNSFQGGQNNPGGGDNAERQERVRP